MLSGETYGLTVMILDTKPSLGKRKKVRERALKNLCLGESDSGGDCPNTATRRGLCTKCYQKFMAAQYELGPNERPANEARAIRNGRLLQSRQGQRIRSKNPFRKRA